VVPASRAGARGPAVPAEEDLCPSCSPDPRERCQTQCSSSQHTLPVFKCSFCSIKLNLDFLLWVQHARVRPPPGASQSWSSEESGFRSMFLHTTGADWVPEQASITLSSLFNHLLPPHLPSQLKGRFWLLPPAPSDGLHLTRMPLPLGSSMEIGLPEGFPSLSHWLYNQTDTVLQGLVKQGDPQQVIEYSLALITILNEVKQHCLPQRGLQKALQSPATFFGQVLYSNVGK